MPRRFEQQTILVTGAAGGIGRETARRFAAEGANVHACDLNEAGLHETKEILESEGNNINVEVFDLADPDASLAWAKGAYTVNKRLDGLVNNASAAKFGAVEDLSVEDWRFTLTNELDTVFYATRACWPYLKMQGGVIITIASIAGWHASRAVGNAAHAASKGALISLNRQFAIEGAAHKIRAVSISPGFIATPGTAFITENPAAHEALTKAIPAGRAGKPDDVATTILFAASEEASYLTGTDIVLDGGLTAA